MKDNYDFSKGKRGAVVPPSNKERISIRLDPDVLAWFKQQVISAGGGSYQALINQALREHVMRNGESLEEILRRVIRDELHNDHAA